MVTNFVLLLLAARPNLCISAPCVHNLIPSPSDKRTLSAQMFVWSLIEPDQGTDPAEKEPRKKKKKITIFSAGSVPCLGSLPGHKNWSAGRALGMT